MLAPRKVDAWEPDWIGTSSDVIDADCEGAVTPNAIRPIGEDGGGGAGGGGGGGKICPKP
jgi:hypothetical protein